MAKTFRALGQLGHLVQDATVPAHARNDAHISVPILGFKFGSPDPYEDWVEVNRPNDITPITPDNSVFRATLDTAAPAPVAGLIDTKTILGLNPDLLAGTAIGIAEYANGNFLSKDTMFSADFPFPRMASLDLASPLIESDGNAFRRYFRKQGDGEVIEHFVAEGLLYQSIVAATGAPLARAFTLDRRVLRDYAALLLPRAVGYSAALIDHFFRGDLFASGDDTDVRLNNFGTEAMNGTVTLYYDDLAGKRRPVVGASWPVNLGPGGFVRDLSFTPPTDPAPRDPGRYMLVFKGSLGNEPEAVVGRLVRLPSVMDVRLVRHIGGQPDQGYGVQTVDLRDNLLIDANVTGSDGQAPLRWIPGHTGLLIDNRWGSTAGDMYWAGGVTFSSPASGARHIQPSDLDAQGMLSVAIPYITLDWHEDMDPCTGDFVFRNTSTSSQRGVQTAAGTEVLSSLYIANSVTFTYQSSGEEVDFDDANYLRVYRSLIVPEAYARIGQVVGDLHRDVYSSHNRLRVDANGVPIEFLCLTEYAEVQTLPVSIVEYDPFGQ